MLKLFIATLAILSALASSARAEEFSERHAAIGTKNGVSYVLAPLVAAPSPRSTPTGDSAGLYAALSAMIFGKDRSILEARAAVTDTLEGETDFYWGGFRVWSSKPQWKDGAFQVAAGLPTVSMRAPLLRLPVGPVTLAVDTGVSAEASLTAKLAPLISIPIQYTSVKATFEPDVSASGFIEGYAKWIIIRAGIGGELQLIHSNAKISGTVGFSGFPAVYAFEGYLSLLAGKIYGFVDYFNLFGWNWKRALEPVFADWKGKCIAFSPAAGGADPCAITP